MTSLSYAADGASRARVAPAVEHPARLGSKTFAYRASEMEGRASWLHDP